jgi:hypothetical protein
MSDVGFSGLAADDDWKTDSDTDANTAGPAAVGNDASAASSGATTDGLRQRRGYPFATGGTVSTGEKHTRQPTAPTWI